MAKKKTKKPLKGGSELFAIKPLSDKGIRVELTTPTGQETEHFLIIRGADSDVYTQAESDSLTKGMEAARRLGKSKKMLADANRKLHRELVASLVKDWSFGEEFGECSVENVCKLFIQAPQILEQVNNVAGDRKNFFTNPSQD